MNGPPSSHRYCVHGIQYLLALRPRAQSDRDVRRLVVVRRDIGARKLKVVLRTLVDSILLRRLKCEAFAGYFVGLARLWYMMNEQ